MNRIELAERRYRDIITKKLMATERPERYWQMPLEQVRGWITNYVLPAVEEVYQRPVFRNHATWSQRSLAPGAATPERAAAERVDRALVTEAKALGKLARIGSVSRRLQAMAAAVPVHSGPVVEKKGGGRAKKVKWEVLESVSVTNLGPSRPLLPPDLHGGIPYYLDQLAKMGRRSWKDLVCVDDYFRPVGGMMLKESPSTGASDGAFVISLTPHLFFVGDSITRCMMQRIRCWVSLISEARTVCYEALRATKKEYAQQQAAEQTTWKELHGSITDLQRLCLTGMEACRREACMTLVQVYAEFHSCPDLDWLGIPSWVLQWYKKLLEHNVFYTRDVETLDRIAAALGDLRLLYRDLEPETPDLDAAIATGDLVLVEKNREVYWERHLIPQEWRRQHRKPWQFLWKLALNARAASPVVSYDLYPTGTANSTMYNRWHRLKPLLPPSLRNWFEPGADIATYRLKLPPSRIFLFALLGVDPKPRTR